MVLHLTLLLLLLLVAPATLQAVEQQTGASGMTVRADRMEHAAGDGSLRASGNVEVLWQDTVMLADEALYDTGSKILTANGNIRVTKAGDTMSGDKLTLDTESGRAELENGRIFMAKGNFRADGKQIIRSSSEEYSLKQGGFTTCDDEIPSWKFGASALDVTLDEYATGKHVVFYIKDIPVFYFPYMIYPAKRERQSGFLFPRVGSSDKRGAFTEIPYYWAISPSQEATITLDLQTKRGIGGDIDYRYLRSRTSEGRMGGYLINDQVADKVRGQLLQQHYELISNGFSFASAINLTTDHTFLQDYGEKTGDYNRQYNDSRVILIKSWQQWLASAQGIYTQSYYDQNRANTPLQVIPELSLYAIREQIPGIPQLYFDLDLQATSFYRQQGMHGQRLVVSPQISSTQTFWGGRFNLALFGATQFRAYKPSEDQQGTVNDQSVLLPMAGASLSSSFSRLYDFSLLDLQRLRHELVPEFSYRYVKDVDQSELPLFDQHDRLQPLDQLELSLASHLGGRIAREGAAEYRSLMTLRLRQPYNLSHRDQTDPLTLLAQDGAWGDLILESETFPHRYFKLLFDTRYNHYDRTIASSAIGAELNDQRGNSTRISYRNVRQELEYLEAGAALALTKPFYLGYSSRYSFDKQDFLESYYTIEYRHQCWSVIAGYRERNEEKSWTINFNLAGLFEKKPKL